MMPTGQVKWFDKKKGYGFVDHEGQDVFIHHSEMVDDKFKPENQEFISFEVIPGEKGLRAKNIKKIKTG